MGTRVLIINADDLGIDPAIDRGILQTLREGVVSSATLMVNMPHAQAAAREASGLSLGLHLNLCRGAPLWPDFPKELLGADGNFTEARAASLPADVVEAETRAQLARFTELTGHVATHVDVHRHLHLHAEVLEGLARVAAEAKLPVRSVDSIMRHTLKTKGVATNTHFLGDTGAEPYWTLDRLEAELVTLPTEGVIELMCHPGHRPETLKSSYAAQREVELATFLNPRVREVLERTGIKPVDFRVLSRTA